MARKVRRAESRTALMMGDWQVVVPPGPVVYTKHRRRSWEVNLSLLGHFLRVKCFGTADKSSRLSRTGVQKLSTRLGNDSGVGVTLTPQALNVGAMSSASKNRLSQIVIKNEFIDRESTCSILICHGRKRSNCWETTYFPTILPNS
jgi:hypothetical protein